MQRDDVGGWYSEAHGALVRAELKRLALWLALSLILPAAAQAPVGVEPPFELRWVEGKCSGCTTPWTLGAALFTSRSQAWAVGEAWPPAGANGVGYRVLLHTGDGGRVWTEVPQTEYYAIPPSAAFLDVQAGWIETYKMPVAEEVVLQTRNGGKSWEDVTGKFPVFPRILDANHWWGIESKPLGRSPDGRTWSRTLMRTSDGGRTWTKTPLPYESGDFPIVKFLSANVGWIASLAGDQFLIFRTADGGRSWEKSLTAPPRRPVQVADLFFLDRSRGWVIVDFNLREGVNGEGSYVFATTDGGRTWNRQVNEALQSGPAFWVSFLSERLGFVYVDDYSTQSGDADPAVPALVYTSDAGAHWHKIVLPNYVAGCQAFRGDLLCSASGKGPGKRSGLIVLTIHPK